MQITIQQAIIGGGMMLIALILIYIMQFILIVGLFKQGKKIVKILGSVNEDKEKAEKRDKIAKLEELKKKLEEELK